MTLYLGDCLEVLSQLNSDSVDTLITDPPYGLGFMGKEWDTFTEAKKETRKGTWVSVRPDGEIREEKKNWSVASNAGSYDFSRNAEFQQWFTGWAKAVLRVCKPGAIALVFGGTRTFHRLACAMEDAGWQIRDTLSWNYGSGFPKSLNIALSSEQQLCTRKNGDYYYRDGQKMKRKPPFRNPLATEWYGYGTALKPAWEPIIMAMKPIEGTFAENAEKYGVAGLNIDGGRIECGKEYQETARKNPHKFGGISVFPSDKQKNGFTPSQGRWPANLLLDEQAAEMLDEQSGTLKSGTGAIRKNAKGLFGLGGDNKHNTEYGGEGGASRFFYVAKASRSERNAGLEGMEAKVLECLEGNKDGTLNKRTHGKPTMHQNNHPTVKPLKLMEYLCLLTKTPTGGVVLDPFMGSGTTGIACVNTGRDFIGIEKEKDYFEIAEKRIEYAKEKMNEKLFV